MTAAETRRRRGKAALIRVIRPELEFVPPPPPDPRLADRTAPLHVQLDQAGRIDGASFQAAVTLADDLSRASGASDRDDSGIRGAGGDGMTVSRIDAQGRLREARSAVGEYLWPYAVRTVLCAHWTQVADGLCSRPTAKVRGIKALRALAEHQRRYGAGGRMRRAEAA